MKKGTRILTLALVCIMMMATLAGCGSSKGSGISKLFAGGSANLIEEVGWYNSDVYTLKINADNTYELTYQEHRFGTTDPGIKGSGSKHFCSATPKRIRRSDIRLPAMTAASCCSVNITRMRT